MGAVRGRRRTPSTRWSCRQDVFAASPSRSKCRELRDCLPSQKIRTHRQSDRDAYDFDRLQRAAWTRRRQPRSHGVARLADSRRKRGSRSGEPDHGLSARHMTSMDVQAHDRAPRLRTVPRRRSALSDHRWVGRIVATPRITPVRSLREDAAKDRGPRIAIRDPQPMDAGFEHTMLGVRGWGKFVVAVGDRCTTCDFASRDAAVAATCFRSAGLATRARPTAAIRVECLRVRRRREPPDRRTSGRRAGAGPGALADVCCARVQQRSRL